MAFAACSIPKLWAGTACMRTVVSVLAEYRSTPEAFYNIIIL